MKAMSISSAELAPGLGHITRADTHVAVTLAPDSHDFDAFFDANYDRLVRTVTAVCSDPEMACDAVQDAFVRAYARWGRISRYERPAAWVVRVAINRSRDLRRSDDRRRQREDRTTRADQAVTEPAFDDVVATHDVVALFRRLTPRQRAVAALFYLDDMAVSDVASTLRISAGAVRFHLNKARNELRALIDDPGVEP